MHFARIQRIALLLSLTGVVAIDHQPVWRVRLRSAGPIQFGMAVQEARKALGDTSALPSLVECDYWSPNNVPDSIHFLTEHGRVMRIDVHGASVATASGARVGDSEARIKLLYANQIEVQPHAYTDGHYLVFVPRDLADTGYRVIFETNGAIVLRYRAGLRPTVEYIEGCS